MLLRHKFLKVCIQFQTMCQCKIVLLIMVYRPLTMSYVTKRGN